MADQIIFINGCKVKLIPIGVCACGCGGKTGVDRDNDIANGYVRGRPKKFIRGHNLKSSYPYRINPEGRPKTIRYEVDDNGCHICISHKGNYPICNRNGHGRLSRYVYELNYGPIPPGMIIMHACDNPKCINPLHLKIGTHNDNVQDKVRKNRQAKGEGSGRSKLTETQVIEILTTPEISVQKYAEEFGIHPSTIRYIRKGRIWRHIFDKIIGAPGEN